MRKTLFKIFNKKTTLVISLIFCFLSFSLFLIYNKNKKTIFAQEEITCDVEIPIGEAFEKAGDILENTQKEIGLVNMAVYSEISAANKMIDLALACDIKKCIPVCSLYPCHPYNCNCRIVGSGESAHVVCDTCYEVCCNKSKCNGSPCDNDSIHNEFDKIETAFNQLKGASERIKGFFENKDEVEEKLWDARKKFNECTLPPTEWEKIESGEEIEKQPFTCKTVKINEFKTKEKECKSLFNFFCCH